MVVDHSHMHNTWVTGSWLQGLRKSGIRFRTCVKKVESESKQGIKWQVIPNEYIQVEKVLKVEYKKEI
jgi:hypothetical protein